MTTKRKLPHDRSADILAAAIRLSRKHGYTNVSRDAIAAEAGCTNGLVTHYLGTMAVLRRRVMGEALRLRCPIIVAQGLVARDPRARKADEALLRAAGEWVSGCLGVGYE